MEKSDSVFKQTFANTKNAVMPDGSFSIIFTATNKTSHKGMQLKAADCVNIPKVKVTLSTTPSSDPEKYTLIMSDIDASAEGCHYLTTNLKSFSSPGNATIVQNYDSDDIVDILPYVAPGPRMDQNHAYVWLLFQGVPSMEAALKVRDCRRGYGMNEKGFGAEWFQKEAGLGKLLAFDYHYVKNDAA